MKRLFDRVVVSSDTNPKFIEFWPLIQKAWGHLFGVPVTLALVTRNDAPPDGLTGDIVRLHPVDGIPLSNQAKMARYYVAASCLENAVVMTNDMDLLPLQTAYILDLLERRPADHLFTLGSELYTGAESGKFTAGYLTAEGRVWRKLVNPFGLAWDRFVRSFTGMHVFDHKEDIARDVHHENPDTFSDESLLRALVAVTNVPVHRTPRGFAAYTDRAVCRSAWNIDPAKLAGGTYVEAHLLRPWSQHRAAIQPLIDHVLSQPHA